MTREQLEIVVVTSDKKRFAISEDGLRIRANQGHSIDVALGLLPVEPPEVLYHGTATRFLESILAAGLDKRERHHVHLTNDLDIAKSVGQRYGTVVVLTVAAARMHADGHVFFRSENGVWLTDAVPPHYLSAHACKHASFMTSHRNKTILSGMLGRFVQEYGRKSQKGVEPNDRHHDRKVELLMKRLPAEELSELLSESTPDRSPISRLELETLLANELKRCTGAQRELFALHSVVPYAVPIRRLNAIDEVYVVAVFGPDVLYYEDAEEGFELAQLDAESMLSEHRGNQFDLAQALAQLEYGK